MQLNNKTNRLLLGLSFLAFISLGLPDGLLGVAWPSIAGQFGRPLSRLALLQLAAMIGFFVSSTNAGRMIRILGVGKLLIFSNIFVAVALTGFTFADNWYLIVLSMTILGCGGGAVDAGLNAYSAEQFTKEQVTLLHAFYGLGAMLGPVIMHRTLVQNQDWQQGYLTTLLMIVPLILLFILFRNSWNRHSSRMAGTDGSAESSTSADSPAVAPAVLITGVLLFLTYTGLEVTAGAWSFTWLTAGRGINPETAASWVGIYWGALMAGRIFFGFFGSRWSTRGIFVSMIAAVVAGSLLFLQPWSSTGSLLALPIIGFTCAPLFPLFVSYTPQITGKAAAADVIGKQVAAANIGSALIPLLIGVGIELTSLLAIPVALLLSSTILALLYSRWIKFETAP